MDIGGQVQGDVGGACGLAGIRGNGPRPGADGNGVGRGSGLQQALASGYVGGEELPAWFVLPLGQEAKGPGVQLADELV